MYPICLGRQPDIIIITDYTYCDPHTLVYTLSSISLDDGNLKLFSKMIINLDENFYNILFICGRVFHCHYNHRLLRVFRLYANDEGRTRGERSKIPTGPIRIASN